MNEIEEIWKDIEGFEDSYQISNLGRIKTLPRTFIRSDGSSLTVKPMIRKNTLGNNGYYGTTLQVKGRIKREYIHILLAKTFIPNPNNYPIVRHLNDNKLDNRLDNLCWGTKKDNTTDRIKNGSFLNYGASLKPEQVIEIRRLLTTGLSCFQISRRFPISRQTVNDIKVGRTWKELI